jgi:hypothetical protein
MRATLIAALVLCLAPCRAGVVVGQKLPDVQIAEKGLLVPRTKVQGDRMVLDGREIGYRPWRLRDTTGRVRTVYHLAARMGIDGVNKPYIDAIIREHLDEFLPGSPYKTVTVLNLADAAWGTHGLGLSRLEGSQRDSPHAIFVADEKGVAQAAWGLKAKESAVIILDRDDTVLFFREGRLSPEEIRTAIGILKGKLR